MREVVAAERCAVHPARPSIGHCPVCAEPRCAADAGDTGGSCLVCCGVPVGAADANPVTLRALAGAGLLATPVVLLGGGIASEYVDAHLFSLAVPAVLGVVVGLATERGAGPARGLPLRLLAVFYAVLGAAYGFWFEPGTGSPFHPVGRVLPPYLLAAAAAWLWTVPPRVRVEGETRAERPRRRQRSTRATR
jgi:hypothetical protein